MSFSWQENHALEQEVEQRRQKQKKRRLEDWLESVATNTDDSNATTDSDSDNLQPSKRARHAVPSDSQSYPAMTPPFTTSGSHKRGSEAMASDSDPNAPPAQSNYSDASSRSCRRTHQDARKVYTPKSPEELEFLETPVFLKILPANVDITYNILPNDVHTLYRRLYDTSAYKAIIPHDVQSDVTRMIPNATPDVFISYEAEDTEEADETQAEEPQEIGPESGRNMQAKAELKSLQNLMQVSIETAKYKRHDTAWNHFIHGPLLQMIYSSKVLLEDDMFDYHTIKPSSRVRCESMMSATIAGDCIPIITLDGSPPCLTCPIERDSDAPSTISLQSGLSLSHSHSISAGRTIDYCLVLDMSEKSQLHRMISSLLADADFSQFRTMHVNQTAYKPVSKQLIACSIETKSDVPKTEAAVQLGIWYSAWHKRMYALRKHLGIQRTTRGLATTPQPRLVTVPLLKVLGQEWTLYFACDLEDRVHMYGPIVIGATRDLRSIYALKASLEAICNWIQTSFQQSMEKWFMCDVMDMLEMEIESESQANSDPAE